MKFSLLAAVKFFLLVQAFSGSGMQTGHLNLGLTSLHGHAYQDAPLESKTTRAHLLEHSLRTVYFKHTPPPADIGLKDLSRLFVLQKMHLDEFKTLQEVYAGNQRYIALATRDSDGDGVLDYSVSVGEEDDLYAGKFRELDTDVDGDGIDNLYDRAPYNPEIGGSDTNSNGIPDVHGVDYMHPMLRFSVSPQHSKIQELFFRQYKVALIEKDLSFSSVQMEAIEDFFSRGVGAVLTSRHKETKKNKNYFRAITSERFVFADPELNDGTYAAVLPESQTFILFGNAAKIGPMLQLGLVVHELAHGFHYLEDFEFLSASNKLAREGLSSNTRADSPFLRRMAKDHGWQARVRPASQPHTYKTTWVGAQETVWHYRGVARQKWVDKINKIPACSDHKFIEQDANLILALKNFSIIGHYALTDPYEYYADGYMGYFLTKLEQYLVGRKSVSADGKNTLRQKIRSLINQEWPCFFYWNIEGDKLWQEFAGKTPFSEKDMEHFARYYFSDLYFLQ